MKQSRHLAGLVGPTLLVLSVSEALNLHIWRDVHPTLVYLNGLLFFTGGLALVRTHPVWSRSWPVLITLSGWLAMITGIYRMFFPEAPQLEENLFTYLMLGILCVAGGLLTLKGYFSQKS